MDATCRRRTMPCAFRWVTVLLATVLTGTPPSLSAAANDDVILAARAASVAALVEAGDRLYGQCDCAPRIGDLLAAARTIRTEALAMQSAGDTAAALERYDQAYQLLKLTVRSIAEQTVVSGSPAAEGRGAASDTLQARRAEAEATLESLLLAYGRLADATALREMTARVERLRFEADQAWHAGDFDRGLLNLKAAYHQLKQSIIPLRDGQTLVTTLTFETPRDEYLYEMDRHDTHLLLVNLMLERDPEDLAGEAAVRALVDESMRLHWLAHLRAEAGDYPQAVAALEQASELLIRLLRTSGFSIPM